MGGTTFICPICGKESNVVLLSEGEIVIQECALCKCVVGAFLREKYEELQSLHRKCDRVTVNPPTWVRRIES